MCYSAMIQQDLKILENKYGAIIIRQDWDLYTSSNDSEDLRPPLGPRIYPGYYAPVLCKIDGSLRARLMKYSVEPPEFISDPRRYTSFNARRDNLSSPFWAESFRVHHGFIVLQSFFEWVAVKDLLKAGKVTLEDIKSEFEEQKNLRKQRLKAAGKPYKPTKSELTDAAFRKVVIGFTPKIEGDLLVPVIYSHHTGPNGLERLGFAIVTDDPPPEVQSAGHDRCPVFLDKEGIQSWITDPGKKSAEELDAILESRPKPILEHAIAKAS